MAKGDGGIQELRRGVWRVSVSAGNNPATGKRQRVTRVVHGTKAEARKVRDDIRRGLDNGLRPDGGKVRFLEFVTIFSQARRNAGKASEDRIAKDEKSLKLCGELLGDPPLCKVDARAIEALYLAIRERREAQGFRCGNTTLHGYHVLLKSFFQKAVDYDLIGRNPCNRVEAPKADKPQRRALSLDEVRRLLAAVDAEEKSALDALAAKERRQAAWGVAEDRGYLLGMREVCHVLAVRLGIATGMRLGEVLGLTWGAVDFGRGLVSVARTLKADGTLKEPKTEAGRRVVAVDAVTMAHLKAWKALQAETLDTLCIDVGEASPVLCSATGGFLSVANFERWWRSFRTEAGFPDLRYHELRHTQATQLLAQGVDVKTVQARLGHSDASLTLNWYAHAVPENDRAAADRLGELFREEPKPCRIVELKSA
ncbi:tyrosine-type recombinase/integrase [uncultured Adlercreutzia sp.]|uniref:tyrosine-type recombinase/integrase n=1 Tax=uncultured Adlercreutzia sp. TaxID=875803 RepID=UPI00266D0D28|nr:tyrosine-type recombinase/integrase [uncultured Adlercreutzia sp.]